MCISKPYQLVQDKRHHVQSTLSYVKKSPQGDRSFRFSSLAGMLATAVAWLAQLPPQQKLAVLLGAYGFSAAPLLFWIAWRIMTQLRGARKVRTARGWPHAAQDAAIDRPQCLLLAIHRCIEHHSAALARPLQGVFAHHEQQAMQLDTLCRAVQASAICAASCPAPGKAFQASDAQVLARVIGCRRSVFPKHFSGAPIDRLVPVNSAQPGPVCST